MPIVPARGVAKEKDPVMLIWNRSDRRRGGRERYSSIDFLGREGAQEIKGGVGRRGPSLLCGFTNSLIGSPYGRRFRMRDNSFDRFVAPTDFAIEPLFAWRQFFHR
jgi:hypothetical protein